MLSEPDNFPESNSFINYEATVLLSTDYHILTISSSSVLTIVLKKLTLRVDDPKEINIELNIFIQNTKILDCINTTRISNNIRCSIKEVLHPNFPIF